MLVSAKDMMNKARDGKYAVGQFNINNLEWTKAILNTAQKLESPVILGVSGGAGKYMTGFKTVAAMVKAMDESLGITVPVALHLDHGNYDQCYDCIKAGFTSIMFDGSHFPIEENLAKTKELVTIAHKLGLSIEAEVGAIGGEEDGVIGKGECADPQECKTIADLGVDILAAGIGNIHGVYPANWEGLSFETLAAVKEAVGDMPLVLHGGTGIPDDQITKAISLGVAKINVNTECQLVFAEATRKYIEEGKDLKGKGFDPRKLLLPAILPQILLCFGQWELILPIAVTSLIIFFLSGAGETVKTVFGVIYLLLYILGSLAFFMLMSFFTPSTQQTVLENGTSPSGAYRYEIIQTDDSSGGNVAVHVEPNDRDIHLPFLTFISNGYDRTVYEERPVPSEVGSAEWTTASRADITAQLLEISNDVTLDLTKAQKSVIGIPADTETVYLKDLTDAQLEQLGVPAENDVLTFSGKVCFRSYIAVLEDYFAKDNREISLFN